jgi:hypothetical protein
MLRYLHIVLSGQALPIAMRKSGFCGLVKSTILQEAACVATGAILKREVGGEEQAISADNGSASGRFHERQSVGSHPPPRKRTTGQRWCGVTSRNGNFVR